MDADERQRAVGVVASCRARHSGIPSGPATRVHSRTHSRSERRLVRVRRPGDVLRHTDYTTRALTKRRASACDRIRRARCWSFNRGGFTAGKC
jgi:hypothetical protein